MWEPSTAHQRWVLRCWVCFILRFLDPAFLAAALTDTGEDPPMSGEEFSKLFRIQFATCGSGLAFANLVGLEMLWRSARDWSELKLQPLLGMSGIQSYSRASNITPQSKDGFRAFRDKVYKRAKTHLCWVTLISQEPREPSWCEIRTRGDATKLWCHRTSASVLCHARLLFVTR